MRKIGQESDGIKSNTYYDNDKEGVLVKTSTDIAPVIKTNKELYTRNDGYSPSKDLKRIATIPTVILEIWTKEYNNNQDGNWFSLPKDVQHKILREKLNSSDYRYFRTAPGKI
jgi:hypothetical protein